MSVAKKEQELPKVDNKNTIPYEYQKILDNGTIKQLRENIIKLLTEVNNLSKQNAELKVRNAACSYAEIQLANAEKRIAKLKEDNLNTIENHYKAQKKLENEIENLKFQREKDEIYNRTNREIFNQRIELVNQLNLENEVNKEEIKSLKDKNEKLKQEHENKFRTQEVNNQLKYTKIKKRMIESLQETQKNVTKLNIQYMDVSNKLTLLQNNELLVQIEYQSQKIAELEKNNKILKERILALENELKIHHGVEKKLVGKIKKNNLCVSVENDNNKSNSVYDNSTGLFIKNSKSPISNRILSLGNTNNSLSLLNGYNDSNSIFISGQERKILNLEKTIQSKNEEIEKLKNKISKYEFKIFNYENKYSGLFNFFEDCLNLFFEDEEIKKNQNFYIHIDSIKKCDFTIFSKEEKYSLLVLIMKYLLPIVNINFNATSNVGEGIFKTNLNIINNKFNQTQNFLNDNYLKRAFVGKNNKLKSNLNPKNLSSYFSNCIPIMKNNYALTEPK